MKRHRVRSGTVEMQSVLSLAAWNQYIGLLEHHVFANQEAPVSLTVQSIF